MSSRSVLCANVPSQVARAPALLPDQRVLKVEVVRPEIKVTWRDVETMVTDYCSKHGVCPEKDFLSQSGLAGIVSKIFPRLAKRNGYVVEVNDVISAATRCNTNVQLLATMHDSRTAMGYLSSYMKKIKVDPADVIALLSTVRRQILTSHASTAEDAGTAGRQGKHLLARMHNMALGRQKLAATQCAMFLLQAKTFQTTEQFKILFYEAARDHVCHHRSLLRDEAAAVGSDTRADDGTGEECDDEEEQQACNDAEQRDRFASWYGENPKGTCAGNMAFTCRALLT
jgi:hypothetical protein